ncbi:MULTISPECIES: hypothetical protein [unclassified Okeania]|nr:MULTISPECIES: hypothetical protein [unclassified Okeania]NES78353.1 hypothetical protein [Okeania sp. SIO1H4]NET17394.1 hypothetical protein [Okeania sp. SIO1H6]NET21692.1 hypothetical protein [Okeania sp. SIO1H5]NET95041.1 hypothetical protein [Okeania sp. SIO1H2]
MWSHTTQISLEEGDRRQETGDRRQEENYMGIVNEGPLRVYAPPSNA